MSVEKIDIPPQIEQLTQARVTEIKNDFKKRIAKNIENAVTKNTPKSKIKLLKKYTVARAMERYTVSVDGLRCMLSDTDKDIDVLLKQFVEPYFSKEQRKKIKAAAKKRYKNTPRSLLGAKNRRIYFPLKANQDSSDIKDKVSAYLNTKEYFVLNYNSGYATDVTGKQTFKIGKLIKDNEALYKKFVTDTSRSVDKQYLVLSDYVNDIAYMSTRRGWTSCMSSDGQFRDKPLQDIEHGTLVAYLISAKDPYIFNPLARILLKPYRSSNGETIFYANKSYGLTSKEFETKAKEVAKEVSSKKGGVFKMPDEVYGDDAPRLKYEETEDATAIELLDSLGVKYKINMWGEIIVKGDLGLSGINLEKLPNLSDVIVKGDFYCAYNQLTSLVGAPQIVYGSFRCQGNNLMTLEGAPKIVKGEFACDVNNLISLKGAPEIVGGDFTCEGNKLTTLEYAPEIVKGDFSCSGNEVVTLKGAPQEVGGYFDCSENKLTTLEYGSIKVKKGYSCKRNKIKTLKGAPMVIGDYFDCGDNELTTLQYGPEIVKGSYNCSDNKITSLKGAPKKINGQFNCNKNNLISLEYMPQKGVGIMGCKKNELSSLDYITLDFVYVDSDFGLFDTYADIPNDLFRKGRQVAPPLLDKLGAVFKR